MVSFENDLSLLQFTLQHAAEFDHLRGFEDTLESLLTKHHWSSPCGSVVWDLTEGDFVVNIDQEPMSAEIVFFDPYSTAVNVDMWTLSCFEKLRRRCAAESSLQTTTLF